MDISTESSKVIANIRTLHMGEWLQT